MYHVFIQRNFQLKIQQQIHCKILLKISNKQLNNGDLIFYYHTSLLRLIMSFSIFGHFVMWVQFLDNLVKFLDTV